jgi:hypothetical protein
MLQPRYVKVDMNKKKRWWKRGTGEKGDEERREVIEDIKE